ncbi:hypothetical protein ACROYT_G004527 [Oculina patagonica]
MAPLRTEEENAASDDISQQKQMEEFFEWSTGAHHEPETMGQKFKRKTKENPFVPIGALATVGALSYGLFSFIRGDARMQQYMMRTRVAAQGGTLLAVIAGVTYMLYRDGKTNNGKT